jgi:hypothetical protein
LLPIPRAAVAELHYRPDVSMENPHAIIPVTDPARAIYARLAEGEVLSREEVGVLGHTVLEELRARAERNQRVLLKEAGTLRLTAPS